MSIFRKFSSTALAQHERPFTNELLPDLKDAVFRWHLQSPEFVRLDEESLLRAEIAPTKHKASKVLQAAHKNGMIDQDTGRPDTTKVDRNMVHEMPVLGGISKQREFVMLLFFWEEEVTRWRLLDAEEHHLQRALSEPGVTEAHKVDLAQALKIVQAKKRILPSLRDQSGEPIASKDDQLPRYELAVAGSQNI